MPWYWTDDVASYLAEKGSISDDVAADLIAIPIAHRSDQQTVEDAAQQLLEDGEIPLAA